MIDPSKDAQFKIKFKLNSQIFEVPMQYDLLNSINPEIIKSLFEKHEYEIQSVVSLKVFQSFIIFWETRQFPEDDINKDNVDEHDILNQEIQNDEYQRVIYYKLNHIDKKQLNLRRLHHQYISKSGIEEVVAKHLDDYTKENGIELLSLPITTLYNIFNHKNRHLTNHNRAYQLIIDQFNRSNDEGILILLQSLEFSKLSKLNQRESAFFSNKNLNKMPQVDVVSFLDQIELQTRKIEAFEELKQLININMKYGNRLAEFSKLDLDIDLNEISKIRDLLLPKCRLQNGAEFLLNPINHTAELSKSPETSNSFVINRSIEYKGEKFVIKSIGKNSIKKFESVSFADDSEVTTIRKGAFSESNIKRFTIPASVSKLEDGWCEGMGKETQVLVSPSNFHFKMTEEGIILGKTYEENDDYDAVLFANRNIKNATIPDNIKQLCPFCFHSCESLKQIEISPNLKLTIICKESFPKSGITKITIPKHVQEIHSNAFYDCNKLKTLTFNDESELRFIGSGAFSSKFIKRIRIPASVSRLEDGWCEGIGKETQVLVSPSNLHFKRVDKGIILGKSNIEKDDFDTILFVKRNFENVTIPDNIKQLCPFCFHSCESLKQIEISPNSKLTIICKEAFSKSGITKITIPKHVQEIHSRAFYCCQELQTIEFSNESELRLIENDAFSKSGITKIIIPKHVQEIHSRAFSGCHNLETIEFSNESELRFIGNGAFSESNIKNFTIPASVSKLEDGWCEGIGKKTQVLVSPSNFHFKMTEEGIILGKAYEENDDYDTVLYANRNIINATIPDNIKQLCPFCFHSCESLKQIEISPNSKLTLICKEAFYESGITKITIPKHVQEIHSNAFYNCYNLQTIEFNEESELRFIGNDAFCESGITKITIPKHVQEIQSCAFYDCRKLQTIEFNKESELRFIGNDAFSWSNITSITIPKHVQEIHSNAFFYCKMLQTIKFSDESELRLIGSNAFSGTKIASITIPKHVHEIGTECFNECCGLNSVILLPDSELRIIQKNTFSYTPLSHVKTVDDLKRLQNS